jgi:hypothetical protein
MDARCGRLLVPALVVLAIAITVPPALSQQSRPDTTEDLILGTWRLVPLKSKYSPGPGPKSETRTYERSPDGLKATVARVYANGNTESITYLANLDSVNPVFGATEYDTVRLKRITDYESEAVLAHADVIFGIARRVVSRDGKTMTISLRRESQVPVYNFAFYEKQPK